MAACIQQPQEERLQQFPWPAPCRSRSPSPEPAKAPQFSKLSLDRDLSGVRTSDSLVDLNLMSIISDDSSEWTLPSARSMISVESAYSPRSAVAEGDLEEIEEEEEELTQHGAADAAAFEAGEVVFDVSAVHDEDIFAKTTTCVQLVQVAVSALKSAPLCRDLAAFAEGEVGRLALDLSGLATALLPDCNAESMFEGLNAFEQVAESVRCIEMCSAEEESEDLVLYCEAIVERAMESLAGLSAMMLPNIYTAQAVIEEDEEEEED